MVRRARELIKSKGLLSEPSPRKGKTLSKELEEKVIRFFCDDRYSRMLPGQKDKVSIAKNVYKQKRLLLSTVNELHVEFKKQHPSSIDKIGISKFTSLRPKWCVSAGSSQTHSVCVCTIHQNVKLLLDAAHFEESYRDLIKILICGDERRDCLLLKCDQCPKQDYLTTLLLSKFEDEHDTITFKEWVSVDRTQLITRQLPVHEFIDLIVEKLVKLTPHSFIAKEQSNYLKARKENLDKDSVLVLLDFSENYAFRYQDEVQSYHWSHDYCSVHPAVCYYIDNDGKLGNFNMCYLSAELQHDVAFVYSIQIELTKFIRVNLPHIENVEYFSDGCAAQYKNCSNFLNLCKHKSDFGLNATWSFFATSHGKSPCDGIGGTVKRATTHESLRRPESLTLKSPP